MKKSREIKNYLKTNENENTVYQNLWDAAKVVTGGKFMAIQIHLKRQEKSQINKLNLYLKELKE